MEFITLSIVLGKPLKASVDNQRADSEISVKEKYHRIFYIFDGCKRVDFSNGLQQTTVWRKICWRIFYFVLLEDSKGELEVSFYDKK